MFTLKIHTVDFPEPLRTPTTFTSNVNRTPIVLMGVAHLFRELPSATHSISARTTRVFVVAVPNYLSPNDFLVLCGNHVPYFEQTLFLKNDGGYSVLITLESELAADEFYRSYNGKRFKPPEVEVCHLYFAQSVQYTKSEEIASLPPPDYTELPSCPVCLERLDTDTSGIQSRSCDHSDHCSCISKWSYKSCPVCRRLCQQQDEKLECAVCGNFDNLWLCLICGFVACKRYVKGHASEHWDNKQHRFALEVRKEGIWDYFRDLYVDGKSDCNSIEAIVDLRTRHFISEVEIQQQRVRCIQNLTNELDNIMWSQAKLAISEVVREKASDAQRMDKEKKAMEKQLRETEKQCQDLTKKWQEAEIEKKAAHGKCQEVETDEQRFLDIMDKKSIQQEDEIEYLKASNSLLQDENKDLKATNSQLQTEKENLRALNKQLLNGIQKLRSDLDAEKKLRESWEAWD